MLHDLLFFGRDSDVGVIVVVVVAVFAVFAESVVCVIINCCLCGIVC